MSVRVVAQIQTRGTGARDEPPRQTRSITVDAEDFEAAKTAVHDQLQEGWLVSSWRVESSPADVVTGLNRLGALAGG